MGQTMLVRRRPMTINTALLLLLSSSLASAQTFVTVASEGTRPSTAPVVSLAAGSVYRWGLGSAAVGQVDTGPGPWCPAVTVGAITNLTAYNWPIAGAITPTCTVPDISPGNSKSLEVEEQATQQSVSVAIPGSAPVTVIVPASGSTSGPPATAATSLVLTGADPTGATDSYAAIQAAINAAISSSLELYVPAGGYKVSAGLVAKSANFRMRGAGSQGNATYQYTTSIAASAGGYTTLTIGPGTVNSVNPSGYLKDIELDGNGRPSSATGYSCLQLNGVAQFSVENLACYNSDIGIDAVGDSYGAIYKNLRVGFYGNVNAAVYIRNGNLSGSDIIFDNLWASGVFCGVCISGEVGNLHFRGGQISAGPAAPTDSAGAVVIGYDYLTGVTGGSGADFASTSFEGTQNAWIFRDYTSSLVLNTVSMNPAEGVGAIGVFKGTNLQNAQITFHDASISGLWSSPQLFSVSGSYGSATNINLVETNTVIAANAPTINGVKVYGNLIDAAGNSWTSMLGQSGLAATSSIADKQGLLIAGRRY
jgi:Pectate lyase superfamily protein